jgi:hypothetical protein
LRRRRRFSLIPARQCTPLPFPHSQALPYPIPNPIPRCSRPFPCRHALCTAAGSAMIHAAVAPGRVPLPFLPFSINSSPGTSGS